MSHRKPPGRSVNARRLTFFPSHPASSYPASSRRVQVAPAASLSPSLDYFSRLARVNSQFELDPSIIIAQVFQNPVFWGIVRFLI